MIVRVGQWIVYALFRAATFGVARLPLPVVFRLGGLLGAVVGWVAIPYRRLARRNLELAFGEGSGRRVSPFFRRLGANLLSGVKLAAMPREAVRARVEFEGLERAEAVARSGRGFVYAIGHLGCWEMLTQLPEAVPGTERLASLYQPLGNPFLDRHVKRLRERVGIRLLDRRAGFNAPVEILRAGGCIGVLVDQHAGDKGVWSPFFGRLASTSTLAGLLARRAAAPVFPIGVFTTGTARWKVVVGDPIDPGEFESVEALTAALNGRMAGLIARSPEDWFWVHRRWKTPQPNFLLRRYKRGICLPPDVSASDLKPFRLLVRSPNWLGDACLAVPAIRAIRRGRPDLRLTVLSPAKLAPMWRRIDEADAVIERGDKASVFSVGRTIRAAGPFDAGLLLPNSTRSALEMRLGGVPERFGFRGSWRARLLTKVVRDRSKPGPVEHHARHYLRLAQELGADIDEPGLFAPIAVAGPSGAERGPSAGRRIGICPGAEYGPAKRWPAERFAEAAHRVAEAQPGIDWVVFGVAGDAEHGKPIEASLPDGRCRNLVGRTTLDQLIEELAACDVLLTNDTGTMHLAALLGVPTVSVFGSTDPHWTGPLGEGHRVVRRHVECSPCFLRDCPLDFRCMFEVTVDEVVAAVEGALAGRASGAAMQTAT